MAFVWVMLLHNNLGTMIWVDLEQKLATKKGIVFVVVEGIYSMDGDMVPLKDLVILCEQYQAYIIIDEAHSGGIIGDSGEGLAQYLGLEHRIFARVHTFGKALGGHGAAVLGSKQLISYLLNFSRSFIYTTAIPPHSIAFLLEAYQQLPQTSNRERLMDNIRFF